MDKIDSLIHVFELLRDGNSEDASYAMHHLADAIELEGAPDLDELQEALRIVTELLDSDYDESYSHEEDEFEEESYEDDVF